MNDFTAPSNTEMPRNAMKYVLRILNWSVLCSVQEWFSMLRLLWWISPVSRLSTRCAQDRCHPPPHCCHPPHYHSHHYPHCCHPPPHRCLVIHLLIVVILPIINVILLLVVINNLSLLGKVVGCVLWNKHCSGEKFEEKLKILMLAFIFRHIVRSKAVRPFSQS